jgi:hypothetical protein
MLSPPRASARLPGYDLGEPTEADARASLHRVFGPERGDERWSRACREAGLAAGRVGAGAELQRAAQALAAQGGPAVAVARSIEIRMRTYARLASRAAAPAGGPA